MRIGFDASALYNNFTGLGSYSRTLVYGLLQCCTEQNLVLYAHNFKRSPETTYYLDNKNIRTVIYKARNYYKWHNNQLLNKLVGDHIDVYHGLCNNIPNNIFTTGTKSLVSVHDLIFKIFPENYSIKNKYLLNKQIQYACENADKIIAISSSTKRDIQRFYGIDSQKIEVVYQACNPIYYHLQNAEQVRSITTKYSLPEHYLLYVGDIIKRKNLGSIIKAMASLKPENCPPLVVVGNGAKYEKHVRYLVDKLKLNKRVLWLTHLADNYDLQAIYQQASMVIYPSFYEGFGIPVIEAMLSKTPVITSNISSMPETAGKNALLVDPGNTDDIAEAIKLLLSDKQLRDYMVESGYTYANDKFNAQHLAKQLMNIYNEMI